MNPTQTAALEKLTQLGSGVLNDAVNHWIRQGKPVVGYLCSYIPEEIFYAADILPYRIGAKGCRETTLADSLMSSITCPFTRACLEFALRGDYKFLDGLVYMNGCENMRRMADNWRHKVDIRFSQVLSVPQKADKDGIEWYKEELRALIENLEKVFGAKITNESLRNAVQLCNETRQLLKRLYELRKSQNPPLTGAQVHSMVVMARTMPKQEYNKLLEAVISEASKREGIANYRARLMIVGTMCDDDSYTAIIEETGGLVVTDASCYGSLYFWEPVELTEEPLDGIAKTYLNGVPCPRQPQKQKELANFIGEMTKGYGVDGIIFERMLHCPLWSCESLALEKDSQDLNIPMLTLEREYLPGGVGQLKTRIQAFLEVIERGQKRKMPLA